MNLQLVVVYLITVAFCSIPQVGYTQKILRAEKNTYIFEQNEYKFKELDSIMQRNDEAYYYYSKSLKNQKNTKSFAFLTVTSGIATGALIHQANTCNGFLCGLGDGVAALGTAGIGLISLFALAANSSNASKNKKKSIDLFNHGIIPDRQNQPPPFDIIVYPAGIGIVVTF